MSVSNLITKGSPGGHTLPLSFIPSTQIHSILINLSTSKVGCTKRSKAALGKHYPSNIYDSKRDTKLSTSFHLKKKTSEETWWKKNLKYSHSCLGSRSSFFHIDKCLHLHRGPSGPN